MCFGALTIGPMQANLSLEDGAKVIAKALDMGVNFIDTAKMYRTYPYIKRAVEMTGRSDIIVSAKSYDYTYEGMKDSIEEALRETGLKQLGIFSLHEQEDIYTLRGHADAIRCMADAKKAGLIRAVGVSTHNISCVNSVALMPEIDVILSIANYSGVGIGDGDIGQMLAAIKRAREFGKGIYTMKPIGGGNLIGQVKKCFDFLLDKDYIDSVAVGMQSEAEVIANVSMFDGREVPSDISDKLRKTKRRLLIDTWCVGCGRCVRRCTMKALRIENNRSVVDPDKCRLCGYCATVCPEFCIKII